jgi:biotin carboxyl carrier protein
MRTYQLNVNGRDYVVEIDDPNASPVVVRVNGKTFKVTIAEQVAPAVRPVATAQATTPQLDIELESYVPAVTPTFVESVPAVELESTTTAAGAPVIPEGGVQSVVAPMPGKIMDIAVQAGARVKQGDELCNLEAMKMKTPIRSTADGVIAQVLVSEGQNVNYGDVLFTLGS